MNKFSGKNFRVFQDIFHFYVKRGQKHKKREQNHIQKITFDFGWKTFVFWWFQISKGINFHEIDKKNAKKNESFYPRKFLPEKVRVP